MHLVNGAPKNHTLSEHGIALNRQQLVDNTNIITNEPHHYLLEILEAILIQKIKPKLNQQFTGATRTLRLISDIFEP